jgi:uncharacterized membrane protein (DUF373 family)
MASPRGHDANRARRKTAEIFHGIEQLFYVAIAGALTLAGVVLFGWALYSFVVQLGKGDVTTAALGFLDGLLLVFIVAEIIHTVRAVIDENVLTTEPFLIVGMVAAIRRIIVISAEAKAQLGRPEFGQVMLELGLLAVTVLALGFTIYLVRHTTRTEPRPAHGPPAEESPAAAAKE